MKIKEIFIYFFNEFVYGGHLLSLGAVSVILTSAILLNIKVTIDCFLIVYLGGQVIYLYNRYKEFKTDFLTNPERTQYLRKYIKYVPFIIICHSAIIVIVFFYNQKFYAALFAFLLILLGLLYSQFFKKITASIVSFKNFFVSLIWALLVAFLVFYYSLQLSFSVLLVFMYIYLRFFIHESFSDIKDIESDKKENLLTFPIVLGKENLLKILGVINVLAFIPLFFGIYWRFFPVYSLMLFFTVPYTIYYLGKARELDYNQNFLYNVLGDGEFILWSFFIFLGKVLL